MLQLNNLDKLTKKRKRVGRGGSRGGTSGKGGKGQTARSGGSIHPRFEGGQMPISRRLPKRGFSNALFKITYALINLDILQERFEQDSTITKQMFFDLGYIKRGQKIKLLGNGSLQKKLVLEVDACSKSAKEAVERVGGEIKFVQE